MSAALALPALAERDLHLDAYPVPRGGSVALLVDEGDAAMADAFAAVNGDTRAPEVAGHLPVMGDRVL